MICAVAERLGFCPQDAAQIALAVDEAVCNIIKHGYERREDGRIWISVWPIEEADDDQYGIRILLEDEGRQTVPSEIKSRPLNEIRPGGLGVHIIRKVMDVAEYSQRPKRGMQLVLEKYGASPCSGGDKEAAEECGCHSIAESGETPEQGA